jgi:hypothetical protein
MKSGKRMLAAAAAALVCGALAPAGASAAVTATVTGDDGNPAALNPAAPLGIRNMDVKAIVNVTTADAGSFSTTLNGPDGVAAAAPSLCQDARFSTSDSSLVNYRGNGIYTLTVALFTDNACKTAKPGLTFQWGVNAAVGVGQPATPLLTRAANSFSTVTQALDFAQNPGAWSYEIKYALGGVLAPDGSISGPVQDAFLDRTTGKVQLLQRTPGTYIVVARAKAGDFYTPWSAPVTLRLMAPFDLSSTSFPDSRGPSYQVRGIVGETSAGGRVTVAAAKGAKGGRFRTLGKAKVNSKGVFALRFRLKKLGVYRLRYSFAGSSTVARGSVTEKVRIRRTRVG